jgi:pimeloyl-ACP methyl ester carboxylesterase
LLDFLWLFPFCFGAAIALTACMKHLGTTPQFRDARGSIVPDSVAEVAWLRLGGIDQWVMTRGEHVTNPPLIMLHGGPGFSETQIFRRTLGELEKSFTLVYWDQRGAGKSFDRWTPPSSMTLERFVADLDELVDATRHRTGHDRVGIFGHSWGSALGVLYAARFPHKVAAYVGCGQGADWVRSERDSYAYAMSQAQSHGDRRGVEKLREIGPPPYDAKHVWVQRRVLSRHEGRTTPKALFDLSRVLFFGGDESSILDLPNTVRGFRFTQDNLWDELQHLNLAERVPALKMPVFFFLGGHDHYVPTDGTVAYFDALDAPSKTLVWFENSGHEPFIDEPRKARRCDARSRAPDIFCRRRRLAIGVSFSRLAFFWRPEVGLVPLPRRLSGVRKADVWVVTLRFCCASHGDTSSIAHATSRRTLACFTWSGNRVRNLAPASRCRGRRL